jgi:RES domain-containing protein
MTVWRICKPKYEATAFDGAGAAIYPGRWNKHGQYVVYTSDTPSLAVLEILVNSTPQMLPLYKLFPCSFDDALITDIGPLPGNWRHLVNPSWSPLQEQGSAWYESRQSAVLRVPSAIIPDQSNYILNVRHPAFFTISIGVPRDMETDPRLIKA